MVKAEVRRPLILPVVLIRLQQIVELRVLIGNLLRRNGDVVRAQLVPNPLGVDALQQEIIANPGGEIGAEIAHLKWGMSQSFEEIDISELNGLMNGAQVQAVLGQVQAVLSMEIFTLKRCKHQKTFYRRYVCVLM
jgi:hypothetical protein